MMAALYLPVGEKKQTSSFLRKLWERWDAWFEHLTDRYASLLEALLDRHQKKVLVAAISLFIGSLFLFPYLGSSFLPLTDQSQFTVKIKRQAGETVEAVDENTSKMISELQTLQEIRHIYSTSSAEEQILFIRLAPKDQRPHSQQQVMEMVRQKLNQFPGVRIDIEQGDGKPVVVSITGDSVEKLGEIAEVVQKRMEMPGVQDISSSHRPGMPDLNLTIRSERASDLEVSSPAIGSSMQTLLTGSIIGKYSDGEDRVDIRVRLNEADRSHPESLSKIYVPSEKSRADGKKLLVPLSQVAQWKYTTSPSEINRYDRQKEIRLSANLDQLTLGDFNDQFYPALADIVLPPGYQIGASGESDDMDESFSSMVIALMLAIAFIFMILAAQFESYTEPFAIMFSLPLAMIGALLGLFLAGSELSIISAIGIMMLMGLVTKNAILLIDFAKQRMQQQIACNQALVEAARIRLRPILMTSAAMIFGMLPIALGIGPGSEARAPMAHAIIGGLITSTLLTLVVVPVIYSFIHRKKSQ